MIPLRQRILSQISLSTLDSDHPGFGPSVVPAIAALAKERKSLKRHETINGSSEYQPGPCPRTRFRNNSSAGHEFAERLSQEHLAEKVVHEQDDETERGTCGPHQIDPERKGYNPIGYPNQHRQENIGRQVDKQGSQTPPARGKFDGFACLVRASCIQGRFRRSVGIVRHHQLWALEQADHGNRTTGNLDMTACGG